MKCIIAGPRDYEDYVSVLVAVHLARFDITEVVSGRARGVDTLGERWAKDHGIPVKPFPANWTKFGNGAGPIRNKEMAEYADGAIVLWDGLSKGSRSMVKIATATLPDVFIYGIRGYRHRGEKGYRHGSQTR